MSDELDITPGFSPAPFPESARQAIADAGYDPEYVIANDAEIDLATPIEDRPVAAEKLLRGLTKNEQKLFTDSARELTSLFREPPRPFVSSQTGTSEAGSVLGEATKEFRDAQAEEHAQPLSDLEMAQWGLELITEFNFRDTSLVKMAHRIATDETVTPKQKLAFHILQEMYDKKKPTWDGIFRAGGNLALSPSSWLGLTTLGIGSAAAQAWKQAGKQGIKNYIKAYYPTALAVGIEAGAYTSLDDAAKQFVEIAAAEANPSAAESLELQDEFNLGQNLAMAGVGTALGTAIGGAAPAAISKAGDAFRSTVDAAMDGAFGMGVGPIPGKGKQIAPSNPPATAEDIAAAKSDTRLGADIVGKRLNVIVPESERVAGGVYTPGRPDGRDWSTLTPNELAARGPGFKGTDEDLQRLWDETISEVSEAAKNAVSRTGANWAAFKAQDWDKALRLPLRSQLWYELSGEKFLRNLPGLSHQEHMMFLDLIGATSARAKPGENLERALAVLSQRLRGVPVDVDVTIPSTVSDALKRGGTEVSSDLANKTGMFSDTLALTAGIPVRYPISVNDVWVGRAFGITDAEMSANQSLHEVFGKYMNKLRDEVNSGSGENAVPHQSWHLQARQWVELRAADDGIDTSKGTDIEGSDYAGEWGGIVNKLEAAGIDVPDGIITRDILTDPRLADALRKTTPAFRQAPKATVEFGTLLTPHGRRGAEIFTAAKAAGDQLTQNEYLKLLTSSMYASGRGKPTLWENTVRVATGGSDKVTRIYSPKAEDPFAISGTFEGAAAPNIRVPLKNMSPDQIAYFNAMAGQGLRQKAMAAAQIRRIKPDDTLAEGEVATSSIRFDWEGVVPEELVIGISRSLGEGFEVSVARYPDGLVVDVNPRFGDAGPEGPDADAIDAVEDFLIGYGVKNIKEFPSAYKSEYGKNYVEDAGDGKEYRRIIRETLKGWEDGAATEIVDLAGGGISKRAAIKFLRSTDAKLEVSGKDLKEGASLSSVRGRAATIRKTLQRRLSDHDDTLKSWQVIGKDLDGKMGKAIPKWERRAAKLTRKQNPPTEAGFSLEQ